MEQIAARIVLDWTWIASILLGTGVFTALLAVLWPALENAAAVPAVRPPAKLKLGLSRPRRRLTQPRDGAAPVFSIENMRRLLDMAGHPGSGALAAFLALQALGASFAGGVTYGLACCLAGEGSLLNQPVLLSAAAAVAGFLLPPSMLTRAVEARQRDIARHLPDAIDLLVLCLGAGLSLETALRKVAPAFAGICPPLAAELNATLAELSLLPSRAASYGRLGSRSGSPQLQAVASHFIEAEQHGIAVAASLAAAGRSMREEALADAERKAAALPPKLAIPLVVFFMPVLFVIMLGPALMRLFSAL
jgi:tight adherence protein C